MNRERKVGQRGSQWKSVSRRDALRDATTARDANEKQMRSARDVLLTEQSAVKGYVSMIVAALTLATPRAASAATRSMVGWGVRATRARE